MDFSWSEEELEFKNNAIEFAQKELNHNILERDQKGIFSRENWKKCAEQGVLGLSFDEAYGGLPTNVQNVMLYMEGLGYGTRDSALIFGLNAQMWSVQFPIAHLGTELQKQKYLKPLIAGQMIGAHGMSEPESGSDAFSLNTTATKVDGGYLLNGTKMFVTNAPEADIAVIFATTDKKLGRWGITAFIVETNQKGFSKGKDLPKMGLKTCTMGELFLQDCFVPDANILGKPGSGAAIFFNSIDWERSCILGSHIGEMEYQLETCIAYSKERMQFKKSIDSFQSVSNRLANMKIRLETSRLLLYKIAWQKKHGDFTMMDSAIAKLHISEAYVESSMDAIRIHGGYGYLSNVGIEKNLRDSIGSIIYSGTSDIQRNIIANQLKTKTK